MLYSLDRGKFVEVMKWNVILSFTASISTSIALLFGVAIFHHYWWLYVIDFPINGLCCFFMIGANRRFLFKKLYRLYLMCHLKCEYDFKSRPTKPDKDAVSGINIDMSDISDIADISDTESKTSESSYNGYH